MTDVAGRLTSALSRSYRIERELGAGGMATVYLAHDLKHGRKVAIKVLRQELAASLGAERFLREVQIAAKLQHPHILTLIDSGEADGFLYYVMPYVDGETLRARLAREGEFPVGDAVRILRELADALAYAHGQGVVHRDVKPENVMLSGRQALVMDFGVAKAVTEATGRQSLTTVGVALGTPTYMSPEQATADPHVDHRADIYALGVMAYELLTGQPRFTGNTPQQVIAAHLTQAPDPVTRHRAAVPAPLAELVTQCLEKKPADRPQSAKELLDRFEEVATPSGGMTPTGTAPHPAMRRSRVPIIAGAAAVVLLAVLGGLWVWRGRGTTRAPSGPRRLAVVPFENLGPPDQAYFAEGLVDEVRTRLTGLSGLRVIARTSSEAYRGAKNTPQQVGKELGVQYLLTGRVRWQEAAAGRAAEVRVSPELIRTDDGTTAWEQSFDADPSDAFAVQSRIAGEVLRALNLALTPQDSSMAGARPTANTAAYDAYLQGEALVQRADVTDGDGRPAVVQFERAVALDPAFALAYARLSYAHMVTYWILDRTTTRLAQGTAAAERAQALAPDLPEARLAVAYVRYWGHRDYEGARRELDPALRARPNDVRLLKPYSYVARRSGHWSEAIATMRREADLDPRNGIAIEDLAETLTRVEGAEPAEPLFEQVALLSPQYTALWQDWFVARTGEGNADRTRDVIHRAETALGTGFASFLTTDQHGLVSILATVADPGLRSRLLVAPTVGDLPSDSAPMMTVKSALARAADDDAAAARYADAAWSIYGRLALRDTAEANWRNGMGRAALLAGRTEDAIREARRAVEMLPPSLDHVDGPNHLLLLAEAHAAARHPDSALAHLRVLLTLPSFWKPGAIRLMPTFATLRNDARFVKLLEGAPK